MGRQDPSPVWRGGRGPETHLGNQRRCVQGFLEEETLGPEAEGEGEAGGARAWERRSRRGGGPKGDMAT